MAGTSANSLDIVLLSGGAVFAVLAEPPDLVDESGTGFGRAIPI